MMNKFLKIFESPKMAEDPVCHMRVLVEKPGEVVDPMARLRTGAHDGIAARFVHGGEPIRF